MRSQQNVLFLSDGTAAEWLAFIRACVDHDFYHLPFYHRLAMMRGGCRAVLIRYEEGANRVGIPFLLRPVAELGETVPFASSGCDAISVYGYPGPASSHAEFDPAFVRRFHDHLIITLRELGVISAFSRLHPITNNARILRGLGELHQAGETISIDTTLTEAEQVSQYRKGIRSAITRLETIGVVCRDTDDGDAIEAFADMYAKAMQRLDAPPHLRFNAHWFRQFLGSEEAHARLFMCTLKAVPLCGGVVTLCNGVVEVHLAATNAEYAALSPSKLLFDRIRRWGIARGARVVHLGGGVGASRDSLHQFKSGFSKRWHSFSTWRLVVDEARYHALTSWYEGRLNGVQVESPIDFFPAYRRPLNPMVQKSTPPMPAHNQSVASADGPGPSITGMGEAHVRPRRRIIILGAGGHAKVVADALNARSHANGRIQVIGFLDDREEISHQKVLGLPVLGLLKDLPLIPHDGTVVAIGDNRVRKRLFGELVARGEKMITVVHPRAVIAPDVRIGMGSVVFAGVVVNAGSQIGKNVILNTGCTVDHDCRVESHAHICPGAHLGGTVTIGEGAFLGIGSTVIHSQSVGAWATIGAGGVVIRSIDEHVTVVGTPARPIQRRPTRSGAFVGDTMATPVDDEGPPLPSDYVSPLRIQYGVRGPHQVAIFGAGGLGREMRLALTDPRNHEKPSVVCFIDDQPAMQGSHIDGLPVLSLDQCRTSYPEAGILCAMGDPVHRSAVATRVRAADGRIASFVHPTVRLSPSVCLGQGCIVTEGCTLTCDITLGDLVILNLHATIGHDVTIGQYTTIGPGVRIGGAVRIGGRVHIGMGAMIVNATRDKPIDIGDGASVGAGSCVLSSVPAGRAVYGSPARPSPGAAVR